jgi:hypothetical protein
MPERVTFLEVEPSEPLVARFTALRYSSDMVKQWQSNIVFHTYYLQLMQTIESFPQITSNTLHRFRPLAKLHAYDEFIYITTYGEENKEELQDYYKLTEEYMDEITKEWPAQFIVPVGDVELSNPDLIGSPVVTREEYDRSSNTKKKKKKE